MTSNFESSEVSSSKLKALEISPGNFGSSEVSSSKLKALEISPGNFGSSEVSSSKLKALSDSWIWKKKVFVKDESKITPAQIQRLFYICNLDDLRQILKKNEIFVTEITQNQYKWIIKIMLNPEEIRLFTMHCPILSNDDYEYGWQKTKICKDDRLYFLRFKNLCMLDIDLNEHSQNILEKIKNVTLKLGFTIRIYKTYNGIHIFITSHSIHYTCSSVKEINEKYGGDIYYRIFSQRFGYKVRLNPKIGRDELVAADFSEIYPVDGFENDHLVSLLTVHDNLIKKHSYETTKNMD